MGSFVLQIVLNPGIFMAEPTACLHFVDQTDKSKDLVFAHTRTEERAERRVINTQKTIGIDQEETFFVSTG
ncbi:hypothetical protein BG58_30980 [Caballeronia jiangsuensis]|nr:hypothetical protein BG58_30980 [Caballeronia jiangsuensis]